MSVSNFQLALLIISFVFSAGDACLFRIPTSWNIFSNEENEEIPTHHNAIQLDHETMSIAQQSFLKAWIQLGKLKFKCPSESGIFPDKLNCRKYYKCSEYNYTVEYCANEMGFEPIVRSCVNDESVPLCKKIQPYSDYKCNDTGLVVYQGHCDKFILCIEDSALISSCNKGDMFDQKLMLCLPEGEAYCDVLDRVSHESDAKQSIF